MLHKSIFSFSHGRFYGKSLRLFSKIPESGRGRDYLSGRSQEDVMGASVSFSWLRTPRCERHPHNDRTCRWQCPVAPSQASHAQSANWATKLGLQARYCSEYFVYLKLVWLGFHSAPVSECLQYNVTGFKRLCPSCSSLFCAYASPWTGVSALKRWAFYVHTSHVMFLLLMLGSQSNIWKKTWNAWNVACCKISCVDKMTFSRFCTQQRITWFKKLYSPHGFPADLTIYGNSFSNWDICLQYALQGRTLIATVVPVYAFSVHKRF